MATVDNPFKPVHDAIWAVFEANTALKALVKLGNRIKLDGKNVNPFKQQQVDSDFPQLLVVPAGGQFEPIKTSDDSELVQYYDVHVSDSDLVVTNDFFPLKWEILKSITKFATNIRDGSTDLSYVKRIFVEDIEEGLKPEDEQVGWTGIMRISVLMYFSIDDLTTIP